MKSGTSLPTHFCAVSFHHTCLRVRVVWFASQIARGAVVQHAPIHRPRPSPVRINTQARRIVRAASLHHRSGLGPRAAVQPVAAEEVVPSSRNAANPGSCCPAFSERFGLLVADIGQRLAVDLLRHLRQRWMVRQRVVPRRVQDRIGKLATFLLVQLADLQEDLRQNVLIESAVARRRDSAAYFHCSQRAELTKVPSFSANPAPGSRYTVVLICFISSGSGARRLPEGAGLVGIDFAHHQEVGLLQRVNVLLANPDRSSRRSCRRRRIL